MKEPQYLPHASIAQVRGERGFETEIDGVWAVGNLSGLARPSVAIVGTRSATAYGRSLALRFAQELGAAGCCIISGLALGIDAAAHEGALAAGTPTIGVLGSGHARFFPMRNNPLAERMIASGGAVLSPYGPEITARPYHFLARNGIVAALADAVLVIEAPARSGALNTAQWAAGRIPVLAVPGDVDRRHVAGCHALIRDGATLARCADDVLEALGIIVARAGTSPADHSADTILPDPVARRILEVLAEGEHDLDTLLESVASQAPIVLAALTHLELEGSIRRTGANRFGHC